MPTVFSESGFRLMIYTRDDNPAHVHIWYQGKEAVIEIEENLVIRDNNGFNRRESAMAWLIVEYKREFLLAEWRKIHG